MLIKQDSKYAVYDTHEYLLDDWRNCNLIVCENREIANEVWKKTLEKELHEAESWIREDAELRKEAKSRSLIAVIDGNKIVIRNKKKKSGCVHKWAEVRLMHIQYAYQEKEAL